MNNSCPCTSINLPYTNLINILFGDCITSTREYIGFWLGLSSLVCFILALLPQIGRNYKNKSVDGLSYGMLFGLCKGLLYLV